MIKTSSNSNLTPMLLMLIGLLSIIVALFMFFQPKSIPDQKFDQLRQTGISIQAKIVDVGRTMGGINGNTENLYETVEAEYFVASKTYIVDGSRKIKTPGWAVGDPVMVIYAPDNPADAFIDEPGVDERAEKEKTSGILFLGGSLIGITGFVMYARNRR